tara:strand:- start:118 stop:306 length:189 start_codon:yes stop_codon:yes gene_type:complete
MGQRYSRGDSLLTRGFFRVKRSVDISAFDTFKKWSDAALASPINTEKGFGSKSFGETSFFDC